MGGRPDGDSVGGPGNTSCGVGRHQQRPGVNEVAGLLSAAKSTVCAYYEALDPSSTEPVAGSVAPYVAESWYFIDHLHSLNQLGVDLIAGREF